MWKIKLSKEGKRKSIILLSENISFKSHLFEEVPSIWLEIVEKSIFVENEEQSEARRVGSEKPTLQHFEFDSGMRSL